MTLGPWRRRDDDMFPTRLELSGADLSQYPLAQHHIAINMTFRAHAGKHIDYIPDDIIIPDLILKPDYGRRPLSQSRKSLLIDAPSGHSYDIETLGERSESLAKGLLKQLGVQVGWDGVIAVFAPNHVCSITKGV